MDSKRFDALTRGIGATRNRRDAMTSLVAGLLGLGLAKGTSAQVSAERATCGQSCSSNSDCNAGLRCSTSGGSSICVNIADSRTSCNRNSNCDLNYELCRNGRCVNQSTCSRCNVPADCPAGEGCRRGNCTGCDRDSQCRSGEVCRNARCERAGKRCNSNRDCRKRERCRNNRCVSRN
jgi:hypothetical protein